MGSDAEVGWQWARQLSLRSYDVTVITRSTHRAEIKKYISETGDCKQVDFEYVDIHWLFPITERFNSKNHLYYYFWQVKAFFRAAKLRKSKRFDLIHHVTWVSFRQPSFMGLLGVPMCFGPVAGGDEIPKVYMATFSMAQRMFEKLRSFANAIVKIDPFMWLTYATADNVFFTSEGHLKRVPSFVLKKASIELAIGTEKVTVSSKASMTKDKPQGRRLLFVGRFLSLKGMDIGLQSFSQIKNANPDVTLTMVGDGPEQDRWKQLAIKLGVDSSIDWKGWLPKADVQRLYSEHDVFFFPSLRDSGGFVVLEALQNAMPVVCLKLGGPGVIVNDSCGRAVIAENNVDETIDQLSKSVIDTLDAVKKDSQLADRCINRAKFFEWEHLIKRIYESV